MLIGVACRSMEIEGKEKYFINESYTKVLNSYENISFILLSNSNQMDSIFSLCDAFILPGGRDIDPTYYGEINEDSDIDAYADELDFKVINYAKKNKIPLLGICRGIQSINVFMGGSLYQDIENHSNVLHDVHLGTNDIYNNKVITTNSFHHQSIKKLAHNFDILGITKDNHIELIKHRTLPIIGVQYHPELNDKILFDYFINFILDNKKR